MTRPALRLRLALRLTRGNRLAGTFRTLLGSHGFQGPLAADLAAPGTFLAEVFENLWRKLLFRHALILTRFRFAKPYFLFLSIGGLDTIIDMKAIGYVRVSTEKQADFGVSLEAQSEKVRALGETSGGEITK